VQQSGECFSILNCNPFAKMYKTKCILGGKTKYRCHLGATLPLILLELCFFKPSNIFKIRSFCDQNSGHPMGFQALLREHDHLMYIINTYELTVCLLGAIPQRIVKLLPKFERCPDLNNIRVEIRPGLA